jgi:hypothetical protein
MDSAGKGWVLGLVHSVRQYSLYEGHSIANIQTGSQQAYNVVFREASLLLRLLQSLYRKKDGHSVFGIQDCQSSLFADLSRSKQQPGYEGCSPSSEPKTNKLKPSVRENFLTTEPAMEEWQENRRLMKSLTERE